MPTVPRGHSIVCLSGFTRVDRNHVYEDMVLKFLEQLALIKEALDESGLYDPDDGFFYDRLVDADGNAIPSRVQTLVGVIPVLVAVSIPERNSERAQRISKRFGRMIRAKQTVPVAGFMTYVRGHLIVPTPVRVESSPLVG